MNIKYSDLIFFIGGVHMEEKSLLEPGCDDHVGSMTEVMDEHADDTDDGYPCLVKICEGGLQNGG